MEITVKELAVRLELTCVSGLDGLHRKIKGVYVSDMLSDVVGHARDSEIWITVHTHLNIVAVASLKNLSAIIISGGRIPDPETIEASQKHQIPVLLSSLPTFILAGKIYELFCSLDQCIKEEQ